MQIGETDSEHKPRFASLLKDQSMSTLTLEEALRLFEFPRTIGEFEGKEVQVAIGRFGPYVRHDGKFVSIPKDIEPAALTLPQAEELIKAKREKDANKTIKTFDEEPDIQVLNGRYGPYIAAAGKTTNCPKQSQTPQPSPCPKSKK